MRSGAKPKFTPCEDKKLCSLVEKYGTSAWEQIARKFKNKTPRQCFTRYKNYVDPSLNHSPWSEDEDKLLLEKYDELGARWTYLSMFFKDRSPNDVRSRFLRLVKYYEKHPEDDISLSQTDIVKQEQPVDQVFGKLQPEIELFEWLEKRTGYNGSTINAQFFTSADDILDPILMEPLF